ncbi:ion transport peptide-like [Panonychus citri]|uniref:ion transport peptide-like n=1 Tax=Panonychus citri TaxID=50023 RepID=UPI002307D70B|nr:ion transport peptide-like [Panonychus citri]
MIKIDSIVGLIVALVFTLLFCVLNVQSVNIHLAKRSFDKASCNGSYNIQYYARLDRICEECYQLYRESHLHSSCKANCFKNDIFTKCVIALLLGDKQKEFENMVNELGR